MIKDFFLMLDGVEAILSLSRHFDCNQEITDRSVEQLASFLRHGHENSCLAGFVAFFLIYKPEILEEIEQDSAKAAEDLIFLNSPPPPANVVLQAVVEMIQAGHFENSISEIKRLYNYQLA